MKIILSRKGFDSTYGGVASPILPDGRMISLPIPERSGAATPETARSYGQIRWAGGNLGRMVRDLTRGKTPPCALAHLDPDLNPASVPRPPGWRPMFGQTGAAETHLGNQQVGVGDLFLFFGWFREVVQNAPGRWQYRPGAPDLHVLFGWLQIERKVRVADRASLPDWAVGHPHHKPVPYGRADSIYLAGSRLELKDQRLNRPGGGVFENFHNRRCLTAPSETRSWWRLPGWFFPGESGRPPLSYHRARQNSSSAPWQLRPDWPEHVWLDSAKQGQEFVLDTTHYPEASAWLAGLFSV